MRHNLIYTRFKCICIVKILLIMTFISCDNRVNTSTLVIEQIIDDPAGTKPIVHVALSRTPDFLGGMKTYSTTYDISNSSSPAIVFDSISWEQKDGGNASEFWLLVAEDANVPPIINDGDNILPAMRVVLKDGQTTTIPLIIFDTTSSPDKIIKGVGFNQPRHYFRIFIEDPNLISADRRIFLRLGDTNTLIAGPITHEISFTTSHLASGLYFNSNIITHGFLWIDIDQSGTLNMDDWVSTPNPDDAPPLGEFNNIILWSGQTLP